MVQAWYYDNDNSVDQRDPHKKHDTSSVSLKKLEDLGVLHFTFDVEDWKDNKKLAQFREDRGYTYFDEFNLTPEFFGDSYEAKLKMFYTEHLHDDEEIRFILGGSGYFDVRDRNDEWIRIEVTSSDLLILPKGIYHRFTLDRKNHIHVVRMFQGEPVWTSHNRGGAEQRPSRQGYIKSLKSGNFA